MGKAVKRQQRFGWSIQGIEKQNKVLKKLFIDFLVVEEQQF